jgi:hypothetical protein
MYRSVLISCYLFLILACSGCTKEQQGKETRVVSSAETSQQKPAAPGVVSSPGVVEQSSILLTANNLVSQDPTAETHTPLDTIVFSSQGRGVAYIEKTHDRQRVVHNGKPGNDYNNISHLAISPDGQRVSYTYMLGDKLQQISDRVGGKLYNRVFTAFYSPDNRHIACLAESIDTKAQILLDGKSIEESPSAVSANVYFTNDSSKLLYHIHPIEKGTHARLVIYDIKSGNKISKECLDNEVVINNDKTRVAITVMEGGKQRVFAFHISDPDNVQKSDAYDKIENFSTHIEGNSVAFTGVRGDKRFLVLNGKEERIPEDLTVIDTPVIRPDHKGLGVILATTERYNRRFSFHQAMYKESAQKKQYDQIKELVYSRNSIPAYVAMQGEKYCIVMNGVEGSFFDKVVSPVFSPDGSKLVYRARNGERRFVVVVDVASNVIRRHPEYEMVFATTFTGNGKSVAYGVKDGNKLMWKVEKL